MIEKPKIFLLQGCWVLDDTSLNTTAYTKAKCLFEDIAQQLVEHGYPNTSDHQLPWWICSVCYYPENPFVDDETLIECIAQLKDVVQIPEGCIPAIKLESVGTLNAVAKDAFSLTYQLSDSISSNKIGRRVLNTWTMDDDVFVMPADLAVALSEIGFFS